MTRNKWDAIEASEYVRDRVSKMLSRRYGADGELAGVTVCAVIHGICVEWQPRGTMGGGTLIAHDYRGTHLGEARDDLTESEILAFASAASRRAWAALP